VKDKFQNDMKICELPAHPRLCNPSQITAPLPLYPPYIGYRHYTYHIHYTTNIIPTLYRRLHYTTTDIILHLDRPDIILPYRIIGLWYLWASNMVLMGH